MWAFSQSTESNLLLEPRNIKGMSVILILISSISTHKALISFIKISLTVSIIKKEPF